jgi:hypothetical protein
MGSFQGEVSNLRCYPFVMRHWERNIMYRAYAPVLRAGYHGEQIKLPLWFEVWLWLRSIAAKAK